MRKRAQVGSKSKNPRYDGKPLLRLLELYVLWAIDELPPTAQSQLEEFTPHLRRTYKAEGDWHQIIAHVMHLPPNMPELIRGLWNKNTRIAQANGTTLSAQWFAETFVDKNIVGNSPDK
jgi:hypothetical protein